MTGMTPELQEAGKATQFGPGNEAHKNSKPWSIRNAQRYLSTQKVNPKSETPFEDSLGNVEQPTGAQLLAARAMDVAAKGDIRATEFVTDSIEGKLAQTTINAAFEDLKKKSDDELLSFITSGFTEIASVGISGAGSEAPGPEDSGAKGNNATATAASVSGVVDTITS